MADVKALAEELVNLSVKDVQELAKVLEEEYGIKPAKGMTMLRQLLYLGGSTRFGPRPPILRDTGVFMLMLPTLRELTVETKLLRVVWVSITACA